MTAEFASRGVIVLGVFRSGTSLLCQVLHELGADFGPVHELGRADRYNPGGYFERVDLVHANNLLMESAGRSLADPGDAATLADDADARSLDAASLRFAGETPSRWALKDPRFCITLSAWIRFGAINAQGLRVIRVRRDVDDIVRSALKYPGVNCHFEHDADRIRRGVQAYDAAADWQVRTLSLPALHVEYDLLRDDAQRIVKDIAAFLECDVPAATIRRATACVGRTRARRRYFVRRLREKIAARLRLSR